MEFFISIFDFIAANGSVIVTSILAIIAGASGLANLTPTQADNILLDKIAKVVNFLALNFFRK
jgi:hypothetical protein